MATKYQQIIELKRQHPGVKNKEVAKLVGCSRGYVYQILYRHRKMGGEMRGRSREEYLKSVFREMVKIYEGEGVKEEKPREREFSKEEIKRMQNLFSRILFYGLIYRLISPRKIAEFIQRTPDITLPGDYELFMEMFGNEDSPIYQRRWGKTPEDLIPLELVENHGT